MENKETKKSVVDNVVVAVLLCDYSPTGTSVIMLLHVNVLVQL